MEEERYFWRSLSQERETNFSSSHRTRSSSSVRYSSNESLFSHYRSFFDRPQDSVPTPTNYFSGFGSYSCRPSRRNSQKDIENSGNSFNETRSDISPFNRFSQYSSDYVAKETPTRNRFETSSFRSTYSSFRSFKENSPSFIEKKSTFDSAKSSSSWITTRSTSSSMQSDLSASPFTSRNSKNVERWLDSSNHFKSIRSSFMPSSCSSPVIPTNYSPTEVPLQPVHPSLQKRESRGRSLIKSHRSRDESKSETRSSFSIKDEVCTSTNIDEERLAKFVSVSERFDKMVSDMSSKMMTFSNYIARSKDISDTSKSRNDGGDRDVITEFPRKTAPPESSIGPIVQPIAVPSEDSPLASPPKIREALNSASKKREISSEFKSFRRSSSSSEVKGPNLSSSRMSSPRHSSRLVIRTKRKNSQGKEKSNRRESLSMSSQSRQLRSSRHFFVTSPTKTNFQLKYSDGKRKKESQISSTNQSAVKRGSSSSKRIVSSPSKDSVQKALDDYFERKEISSDTVRKTYRQNRNSGTKETSSVKRKSIDKKKVGFISSVFLFL